MSPVPRATFDVPIKGFEKFQRRPAFEWHSTSLCWTDGEPKHRQSHGIDTPLGTNQSTTLFGGFSAAKLTSLSFNHTPFKRPHSGVSRTLSTIENREILMNHHDDDLKGTNQWEAQDRFSEKSAGCSSPSFLCPSPAKKADIRGVCHCFLTFSPCLCAFLARPHDFGALKNSKEGLELPALFES